MENLCTQSLEVSEYRNVLDYLWKRGWDRCEHEDGVSNH
jgi:hypothetical protein